MTTESSAAFCISCGDPDVVADGECEECLREDLTVVKAPGKPVEVERCAHCGAVPILEHWDQPTSLLEVVEQTALGSILVPEHLDDVNLALAVREQDTKNYVVRVEVSGRYKDVPVEGQAPVQVRVQTVSCDACSRRHGGYYEAVVQVRQDGDTDVTDEQAGEITQIIEEEVRRLGGLSGSQSYLLKAEARHGGYDYYFGTKPVAKQIAKRISDRYGGSMKHSSTLAGRQDGEEMYRLTVAVRIPEIRSGTVIGFDDEVIEVHSRQGNRVHGRTLPDGEGRTIEERKLDRARILEPRRADVVYAEGGEGQILDPESYDAVQVRLPEGVSSGDAVWAVEFEGRWVVMGPADG